MVEHTVRSYDRELDTLERLIAEMGGIAEKMVVEAVDALANSDTVLAHQVVAADPRLDALQREIEDLAVMTIARRQPVAVDLRELIGAIRVAGDSSGSAISPRTSPSARSSSGPNPGFLGRSSASGT